MENIAVVKIKKLEDVKKENSSLQLNFDIHLSILIVRMKNIDLNKRNNTWQIIQKLLSILVNILNCYSSFSMNIKNGLNHISRCIIGPQIWQLKSKIYLCKFVPIPFSKLKH